LLNSAPASSPAPHRDRDCHCTETDLQGSYSHHSRLSGAEALWQSRGRVSRSSVHWLVVVNFAWSRGICGAALDRTRLVCHLENQRTRALLARAWVMSGKRMSTLAGYTSASTWQPGPAFVWRFAGGEAVGGSHKVMYPPAVMTGRLALGWARRRYHAQHRPPTPTVKAACHRVVSVGAMLRANGAACGHG